MHAFSLCAIILHVIVCLSPPTLLALANYQTLKTRAAANVINWKAKNQYNAALAKSKAYLAQLSGAPKIRVPREFTRDEVKKHKFNDKPPIDNSMPDNNEISDHDLPVDDSFMMHERVADDIEQQIHFNYQSPDVDLEIDSSDTPPQQSETIDIQTG